ncbi:SLC13 family permease [Duffyella gerundensis]|uniref:SLC13 family permease n=1 Tax=Duffyella gerundensis TaxID=1619313 RepID=UPI00165400DC
MATLITPFLRDRFLHLLVVLGIVLGCFARFQWRELPGAVDWHTIITLCGLLLVTKGIESSGYFDLLGQRLIQRFNQQRTLALFLVAAAALLSTFLTNDIALFILVPLTLSLRQFSTLPVSRLIIFEALAVNAGSLLTPVGNPQNILLWGRGDTSFVGFMLQMLPLAASMVAILLVLTWFSFSHRTIERHDNMTTPQWQKGLLWLSIALYLLFVVALELKLTGWALLLVIACFALRARRVLLALDWSLLAVFIVMFVDVWLFMRLPQLQGLVQQVAHASDAVHFFAAIGLSQVISNVPATILMIQIVPASVSLAWAVNIGGFGLLPGSLANLIALRMAKDKAIWWRFHLFSVPMLFIAIAVGWLLLKALH